jgi:hypothetical protein
MRTVALLLFSFLPFLTSCTYYMQDVKPGAPPGPNEAMVVFCRPSRFIAAGDRFPLWDGPQLIGFAEDGSTVEHRCAPGEHVFVASAQTYKGIPATLAGGKVYYVWVTPRVGALVTAVGFTPVLKDDQKLFEEVRASIEANRFRAKQPKECESYEADWLESVQRAIEDFKSGKRECEPALRAEDGRGPTPPPQG